MKKYSPLHLMIEESDDWIQDDWSLTVYISRDLLYIVYISLEAFKKISLRGDCETSTKARKDLRQKNGMVVVLARRESDQSKITDWSQTSPEPEHHFQNTSIGPTLLKQHKLIQNSRTITPTYLNWNFCGEKCVLFVLLTKSGLFSIGFWFRDFLLFNG